MFLAGVSHTFSKNARRRHKPFTARAFLWHNTEQHSETASRSFVMPAHDPTSSDARENGQALPREERALIPQTPRGEATRQRILEAAEEVFGEMGYYDASISEITRRAKVAQGTFYIYFHSKREIFAELVEDIGKRLRANMRAAIVGVNGRLEIEKRGFE